MLLEQLRPLILKQLICNLSGINEDNIPIENHQAIFDVAFTHTSYRNSNSSIENYETLETLGDSVISLIVIEHLYKENLSVSELNRKRNEIVCGSSITHVARSLKLENYIRTGSGCKVTDSIVGDVYEAMVAAFYLSFGLDVARKVIENTLLKAYRDGELVHFFDYKTVLQEFIHSHRDIYRGEIKYIECDRQQQPGGKISFYCRVLVGTKVFGLGTGHKIKDAEQSAAKLALVELGAL